MSDRLSVAALIPVYREPEDMFRQALQSMLLQSRPLDQLVVVDDSGAGTYERLVKITMERLGVSCKLEYVRNPVNLGLVKSLNAGLAACTTDVVARMDADDISLPYRIDIQLEKISEGYELVGGGIVKFGNGNLIPIRYPHSRLKMLVAFMKSNPFAHPTVMFRRASIQALGGYREVAHAEDLDLWIRCLRNNIRMTNVLLPVLMYRLHAQQVSEIHRSVQRHSTRIVRRQVASALLERLVSKVYSWRNT